jgi:hypothetical protein
MSDTVLSQQDAVDDGRPADAPTEQGTNIFVARLGWNVDDDELREYVEALGLSPVSTMVKRHADSRRSKGWG